MAHSFVTSDSCALSFALRPQYRFYARSNSTRSSVKAPRNVMWEVETLAASSFTARRSNLPRPVCQRELSRPQVPADVQQRRSTEHHQTQDRLWPEASRRYEASFIRSYGGFSMSASLRWSLVVASRATMRGQRRMDWSNSAKCSSA